MTTGYTTLIVAFLLPCLSAGETNKTPAQVWSIERYLDPDRPVPTRPADDVLADVPQRMLQLRPRMTASQFWKTLGLTGATVLNPFGSHRYWQTEPKWASVALGQNRQYEIEVKLDPRNPHPCGVRIRQTNVLHWLECDLGELTEQQKARQAAALEEEIQGERSALMDLMRVNSNAVIRSRPGAPQQTESQQPGPKGQPSK